MLCVRVCLCACRQIYGDLKLLRTPPTHSCSNCGWGWGCGCGWGCGFVSNAIPLTPPPTSHTYSQTWIVCNEGGWSHCAHWVRRGYHARVCLYVCACVRACVRKRLYECVLICAIVHAEMIRVEVTMRSCKTHCVYLRERARMCAYT